MTFHNTNNMQKIMAYLYYYNESGEKIGPITPAALKMLAQQGIVTPTTTIENSKGQSGLARKLRGLFPNEKPVGENPFNMPVPPAYRVAPGTQGHGDSFGTAMVSTGRSTASCFGSALGLVLVLVLATFVVWMLYSLLVVTGYVPPPPAGSWIDRCLMFGSPSRVEMIDEEGAEEDEQNNREEVEPEQSPPSAPGVNPAMLVPDRQVHPPVVLQQPGSGMMGRMSGMSGMMADAPPGQARVLA